MGNPVFKGRTEKGMFIKDTKATRLRIRPQEERVLPTLMEKIKKDTKVHGRGCYSKYI